MATNSNNFVRILAPLQVAGDLSAIKKSDGTDALSAADIQEALNYVPFDSAHLNISNPVAGQVLEFDGSRWSNRLPAPAATPNVAVNGNNGVVVNGSAAGGSIALGLGAITPTSVIASGTITGSNLSGVNTGDQINVTGNAGTATKLQTARTVNGVSFDGTANITINASDATARVAVSSVGVPNGVAPLDAGNKLPFAHIPFTKDIALIPAVVGTALIPFDSTTPLVTEGTQLCNISLGPSSSSSQLFINGCINVDCGTATRTMIVACFRDTVCIGAQVMNFITVGRPQVFPFAFIDDNYGLALNGKFGTYSIRFGVNAAATWYVNRMATASILNGMMSLGNPVYFEELN